MERSTTQRYKLRMFSVYINGPADVLCDDQSVVDNTTNVESKLNKKHNSLAFHAVRWLVAVNILGIGKVHTTDNISDPYTKLLSAHERDHRFGNWTY